ncbi:AfsR/SARP family transcriptional regulator [Actinoplanes friuliensis]|uniref:SARP family transcriptional regulator n=1 Tax=Actinoplanes friuliensis DSM 7358 TaxID=1246995 RepID=U5VRP0_9ACTN|nr:AfsR/SARP family transcriptional regulator [Actinoplanes friuliensis]AGZ39613.1 SARP family transcriptional regulator [Actinoplanes friuliensis DSM 7358]
MVAFGVLGPVRAETALGPVALKGPRHRAVLARLLIARGRVVPVDTLIDDLWEEPPPGAVGAIRTFVADLRRALEPDRPPRQPARVLITAAPGYALQAEDVDAWRFETAVDESADLLATGQAKAALAGLDEALARWRGPAYAEWADRHWARAEIDRLDELRILAVERRAEALLGLGRAADAVSGLQAHAESHPLREDAWHLLITALYRAGRQADALAALRRVRDTLVDELGVDPGPRLRQLETDILGQAAHLNPPAAPRPEPPPLIGRDDELDRLLQAAGQVVSDGRPQLALVSGDAGAGKTTLAEALQHRLGWTVVWGHAPEYDGAPVAWPWPSADQPGGDPATARFRLRQAAVARVTALAAGGPVLLVADDLHRADEATLDLLAALTAEPWPLLVLGTFRATEISPALTAALARFARAEPVRIQLGGLDEAATGALARTVSGREIDAPTARLIHRRSGGNPFFVRELARLHEGDGDALQQVPAGVRDVIRHRLARLPDPAQTVLQQAAVLGQDIDPEVLAALAGPGTPLLDALDAALRAGFLTEDGPGGQPRFTHLLVRDTLYDDLSALRRAHWHARAASALERLRPDDVAALAHHFGLAGGSTAPQAARYARAAAELAERGSRPHDAARLWRQALDSAAAGRQRLAAVMGLGRALAVTGHLHEARQLRDEAITTAEQLDDPELTAEVLAAFVVPATWTRNDDEVLSARIVAAAEHALPAVRGAQRSRLLSTLALELRGDRTGRGDRAAREAEALAREDGDPVLLAFALNARFMHTFRRTGLARERAAIGAELAEVAAKHDLATFEVLGRLILMQAHSALGDLAAADAHAAAADQLADRYDLPVVGVLTTWYAALRLAVTGDPGAARAYREADGRLAAEDMPGMADGLLALALLSVAADGWADGDFGPYEPWVRPLILISRGRPVEAAEALRQAPESPHDLLREARLCLLARAAEHLDDKIILAELREQLSPAAGELAGAGTGAVTLGPVDDHLSGQPGPPNSHRRTHPTSQ